MKLKTLFPLFFILFGSCVSPPKPVDEALLHFTPLQREELMEFVEARNTFRAVQNVAPILIADGVLTDGAQERLALLEASAELALGDWADQLNKGNFGTDESCVGQLTMKALAIFVAKYL